MQINNDAKSTLFGVATSSSTSPSDIYQRELRADALPLVVVRPPPPGSHADSKPLYLKLAEAGGAFVAIDPE